MCGQRQGEGKEKVLSKLKKEVEELEEDLRRQTQMNGIGLNSCMRKTLQSSKRTAQNTQFFFLLQFIAFSHTVRKLILGNL